MNTNIQQWEYHRIENTQRTDFSEFKALGEDGWEFCGDAFIHGQRYLIFKRPKLNTNG